MWDNRARELSMLSEAPENHPDCYMEFFTKRVPLSGASVIDVGCGAGRYLKQLLDAGALAEGLEPSSQMVKETVKYLERSGFDGEEVKIHPVAFQEFEPEKQYDYVFISNSPIIRYYENYEKILRLAKKGIFVGSWMRRRDVFFHQLAKRLGREPGEIFAPYVYYLFNLLMADGYAPEFVSLPERKLRAIHPDECINRYANWLYGEEYSRQDFDRMREEMDRLLAEMERKEGEYLGLRGLLYVDLTKGKGFV